MMILLLAGLILLIVLERRLFRTLWDRGLTASVSFSDLSVREGEKTILKEEIINAKGLPVPALELRLVLDKSLKIEGELAHNSIISDQLYERDLFALAGRQKIVRSIPVAVTKRGHYRIPSLDMIGYGFFYTDPQYRTYDQRAELYVFPKSVDTSRIHTVMRSLSGMMQARRRLYPDPFEFSGIREYQNSDPMNTINWKATARAGKMLVNQFDSTTDIRLTVLLDMNDPNIIRQGRLIEESVRIASSLGSALSDAGMEFDFVSNGTGIAAATRASSFRPPTGTDNQEEAAVISDVSDAIRTQLHVKPGSGGAFFLDRTLASIEAGTSLYSACECFRALEVSDTSAGLCVIISKNAAPAVEEIDRLSCAKKLPVLWIVPCRPDDAPLSAPRNSSVSLLRWETL